MSVARALRYTPTHRCPICGGCERDERGQGIRCTGFLSDDGEYAHCSREQLAGTIDRSVGSGTYGHRLRGTCKCGRTHDSALPPVLTTPVRAASNGTGRRHREPSPYTWADAVATYAYQDEQGALLFEVLRLPDKRFIQRKPDGKGDWLWTLGDIRRVLYRLPELLAADPARRVLLMEGEKDVDRAWSMGLVATCNPHGAGKWRAEYCESLRGRHVVVIADVDDEHTDPPFQGQQHAKRIAAELTGIAKSVVYVELPQHDFSDWADGGGAVADLEAIVRAARAREDESRPHFAAHPLKDLLAKQFPPPKWAVPDLIPHGLSLLAGNPKSGKSFLMLQICLGIAYGGCVLGNIKVERGDVLYVDLENGEEVLQERALEALYGKDCPENFAYVTSAPTIDNGLLDLIRDWVRRHPATRLIVLDTFEAVRPAETGRNQNAYRADYAALRPLADVAKEVRVAIVVIHHLSKGSGQVDDIFSHVNGSYGINGAVDNLMVLGKQGAVTALSVKGRRVRAVEKALNWDDQTRQWTDGGSASEARQSDTRKVILDVLADAEGPLYPSEVAGRSGLKADVVRQRLYHMARDREVLASKGKYQANPFGGRKSHNSRNATRENGVTTEGTGRNGAESAHNTADSVTAPHNALSSGDITAVTGVTDIPPIDEWWDGGDPAGF